MKFLTRLFGKPAATPAKKAEASSTLDSGQSHYPSSQSRASKSPPQSALATRKELLRVVLRDTLKRHGVPATWVVGEILSAMTRTKDPGVYWRLSIRHWDARLPAHCVALQNQLVSRVQMFDPMAEQWLLGITWQFALEDESACPPMPHRGSWTAAPSEDPVAAQPAMFDGDVIAGPVSIEPPPADVKADLKRLMSALDAQYAAGHGKQQQEYAATEPARL